MRAVLDPSAIISGLLSASGAPANLLRAFDSGELEVLASPRLLGELNRALAYPKLRRHISAEEAAAVIAWIERAAANVADTDAPPPIRSRDPGDDYLIGLAASHRAVLVTGDRHLLELAREIPVLTPRELLNQLTGP